jgi:predicted aspartyl protease
MSLLFWCLVGNMLLAPAPGAAPLPLERDGFGRVAVRVRLGGVEGYLFLVDTGSTYSSISPRVASRFRLPDAGRVLATAAGGEGVIRLVKPPRIRLGSRTFTLPWVCVLPEDQAGLAKAYDGILGQDILRRVDYVVDVRAGRLWIDPPPAVTRALDGVRVPLTRESGPLVIADPAASAEWSIDTGASHVVLFHDGAAPRSARRVDLMTTTGRRRAWELGPSGASLGAGLVTWTDAVLAPAPGRAELGLLPLALFDAVHVDHRAGTAVLVPRSR